MSNDITAHVITVKFQEQALTEINELSNHFIRAGFVLTLNDDDGKTHDLGTNTFGLLSAQAALGRPAEIAITTFSEWLKAQ